MKSLWWLMIIALSAGSAFGYDLPQNFNHPVAAVESDAGIVFVVEESGQLTRIDIATGLILGTAQLGVEEPTGMVLDPNGNLAIADSASRDVVIIDSTGAPVQTLSFPTGTWVQRVAANDQALFVLYHDQFGTFVQRRDGSYAELNTFDVAVPCATNPIASDIADIAVDSSGNVWIADLSGCGDEYRLRKYSPQGSLLGSFVHASGQFDADTIASAEYRLLLAADLFAGGDNLYVVLGGTADKGGLEVDVWDANGSWTQRLSFPGPGQPDVQPSVHGDHILTADTLGKQKVAVTLISELGGGGQ